MIYYDLSVKLLYRGLSNEKWTGADASNSLNCCSKSNSTGASVQPGEAEEIKRRCDNVAENSHHRTMVRRRTAGGQLSECGVGASIVCNVRL